MHSVATGYGLPPTTLYDWTLSPPVHSVEAKSLRLPDEIVARLRIEKFCNKVTHRLYSNDRDPVGLASEDQRTTMTSFLAKDFEDLEAQLGVNTSGRFIFPTQRRRNPTWSSQVAALEPLRFLGHDHVH